jgi:hypothetical protein
VSPIQRFRAALDRVPKSAWMDTAVLTLGLFAVNCIVSRRDIGWSGLHPSPYFIVPILVGSRFGFAPGLLSGILTAIIMLFGLMLPGDRRLVDVFADQGFTIGAFIFIGGVCGEIQHALQKRELQLTALNENMRERLKRLDSDLFLLREAKSELERMVATRDSELSTLDAEIRRLFDSVGDELYQTILLLLNRQARVSDAAIYFLEGESLRRQEFIGDDASLPETLGRDEVEMVSLALKHRTPVTIPEFWENSELTHRNYLMAVPLLDSRETPLGVVLVTGMPFITLNKKTVHLVALICRWAARVIEIRLRAKDSYRLVNGVESEKVFTTDFFRRNLQLCHSSFLHHSLPSSVVRFSLPGQPRTLQSRFESLVMATVRGGDFPVELDLSCPNLAVLLPLSGERGANIFIERILLSCAKDKEIAPGIAAKLFTFDARVGVEDFWKNLNTHDGQNS